MHRSTGLQRTFVSVIVSIDTYAISLVAARTRYQIEEGSSQMRHDPLHPEFNEQIHNLFDECTSADVMKN